MKNWMVAASLVTSTLLLSFSTNFALAEEVPAAKEAPAKAALTEIPTEEKAFVEAINKFSKSQIRELLGEPALADDVKLKGSGKVIASIWHYHNINTDENGAYYPTTELDFMGDNVVQVVFLNNDGSEANDGAGKKYEAAPVPEMEPLIDIPPTD